MPETTPLFLVSGFFDPLHSGHIELLSIGSNVVVGLNSDEALERKRKDRPEKTWLLPWEERKAVLESIATVKRVFHFDDSEGHAADFIRIVRDIYGPDQSMIFVNGGDRKGIKDLPLPEQDALRECNVFTKFLQTGKKNSSRDILGNYLERVK